MTFIRPIFESTVRDGWVMGYATDGQVDALRRSDRFRFPAIRDMAVALDTQFNLLDPFTTYVTDNWEVLNSYAHQGLRQLTARFKKNGGEPKSPPPNTSSSA